MMRLAVGRSTIREAMRQLEGMGLVERRPGSGTYLRRAMDRDTVHLQLSLSMRKAELLNGLEIRRGLESEAVALAARRATPAQLSAIEGHLLQLEAIHAKTGLGSSTIDVRFHKAIYEAAGNPLFPQIISSLNDIFATFFTNPLQQPGFAERSFPFQPQAVRGHPRRRRRRRAGADQRHPRCRRGGSEGRRMTVRDAMATLLAQDDLPAGPVVPPIVQTSLFTFDSVEQMERVFAGRERKPIYSRGDNPTVMAFEEKMARLEGGEAARGFASGMAAIAATILAFVQAGERIVAVRHLYPDTYRLMRRLLPRLGIETVFVDGNDLQAMARALPGARLLYLESPTSVVFDCHDIAALAGLASDHGVMTVIDNSWATPLNQRPLEAGIDLVVHSASKYISGHSDTVAGIAVGASRHIEAINRLTYPFLGAKLAPFEAWLLLRGLRTLGLRMRHHGQSSRAIARHLASHAKIARVHHPGLSNPPPGLTGSAGLFSIELTPNTDSRKFCDNLGLFRLGVSWGGHESLVFPMAVGLRQAGEHNSLVDFGVSPQLVRLNVGLEETDDLIADLEQALDAA